MKITNIAVTTIFFALAATNVDAADIACEGCGGTAMQTAAREAGLGNHRIYSISTGVIEGFNVSCPNGEFEKRKRPQTDGKAPKSGYGQSIFPACKTSLVVQPLVLNPETYNAIVATHEFYLETGKSDAARLKP